MNENQINNALKEAKEALSASYSVMPYDESANLYVLQSIANLLIILVELQLRSIHEREIN
jgi:hypothetical protein